MLDGALIQMNYEVSDSSLQRHRLAFLPSLVLEEFQTASQTYLDDEIPADIIMRNIVHFHFVLMMMLVMGFSPRLFIRNLI